MKPGAVDAVDDLSVVPTKLMPPSVKSLERGRLLATFDRSFDLAVVMAPAGAGKTTLLAQLAAKDPGGVAWYRAEPEDRSAMTVLSALGQTISGVLDDPSVLKLPWDSVQTAARRLHEAAVLGITVIIDDFHTLRDSDAERAVRRLLEYLPPGMRMVIASRIEPGTGFNLARHRVSGTIVEISADDLRFRSWEVEQLFGRTYNSPLTPEDVAALTQRTRGWAAGLKLFHLASATKSAAERRQMVAGLTVRTRLVRDYLTTNVLADLPEELRLFLQDTCVLTSLTPELCDQLRDRRGSAAHLADLAARQLIARSGVTDVVYRCHDVLRAYLHGALVDAVGEHEALARHARAGRLLEGANRLGDAAIAYCHAGDWAAAERVLDGSQADSISSVAWPDSLSESAPEDAPWLNLVIARRAVSEGRVTDARLSYRRAEKSAGSAAVTDIARREHRALSSWFDRGSWAPQPWVARVQAAARGNRAPPAASGNEPVGQAGTGQHTRPPQRPEDILADGLVLLINADVGRARPRFKQAADLAEDSLVVYAISELGVHVCDALLGASPDPVAFDHLADDCEQHGLLWLAGICRAARTLLPAALTADAKATRDQCLRFGDPLGAAVLELFMGLGGTGQDSTQTLLTEASKTFATSGLNNLERWAVAASVVMEAGADTDQAGEESHRDENPVLSALQRRRVLVGTSRGAAVVEDSRVTLLTLGGFSLSLGREALDPSALKPRARSLLYLLAAHGGKLVHRDTILAALWPQRPSDSALQAMHVCMSNIRSGLKAVDAVNGPVTLRRNGARYALGVPTAATVDLARFESDRHRAAQALAGDDTPQAVSHLLSALAVYRGDLLPEVGPAEWIIEQREQLRTTAARVADQAASLLLQTGHPSEALTVAQRGLRIDRLNDGLWRHSIAASESLGDRAAAERSRRAYESVLADLGLGPEID